MQFIVVTQVDLSERDWEPDGIHDVDAMNEKLVETVRGAAVRHIGYVRSNGRKRACKPWWNDEVREARKERF